MTLWPPPPTSKRVFAPIPGATIGTVGTEERAAGISVRAADPAMRAANRIRSAADAVTGMGMFDVANEQRLVGRSPRN